MAHTYEELKKMNVAELRELASGIDHEAVQGYTQLNKEKLLPALCTALNIPMHEHHEVVGIDKKSIKDKIKALKAERDQAIEAGDHVRLRRVRRQIHHLKRRLHKATV